ncbi:MAG: RDD family protein [Clostridiaceae bacterium]
MKKIKIITPENIEVEYTLADVASRTAAAIIDTLIQGAVLLLLGISILIIRNFAPDFWYVFYGWIIGIALLIYTVLCYGYYIYMELNMNGSTLGKKLLKLRTIRSNGQSLTLKHSVIRNAFKILIDSFGVGIVFIFFSKEHKRLGDMAASTIVIAEITKTRPVTLESLQKINEHFSYYLSEEEQDLLREYLEREHRMSDSSQISSELKKYFSDKFEAQGVLNEWENFLSKL